ncbi:MAG: DUF402 domain-containing protein [Bacilli bacterium]|nr:DUF402 domain-containing protein [Bacilli bacterium]
MRKKEIEKRTKFTTNTYMKEAMDYDIVIVKENELFITIKKYKKMNGKFTLPGPNNSTLDYIDEGFFVVEYTPLKEHYNIRFYVDKNRKLLDYYIDITYQNGEKYKLPYYVDLYLDIVHNPRTDEITFCDEDELEEAYRSHKISKKDYEMAYRIGNKLLKKVTEKKNTYVNRNVLEDINKYFSK